MACSACSKRRASNRQNKEYTVMGGRKYLPEKQLKARLEVYKKIYCYNCSKRFECNYESYVKCKEES